MGFGISTFQVTVFMCGRHATANCYKWSKSVVVVLTVKIGYTVMVGCMLTGLFEHVCVCVCVLFCLLIL